MTNINQEQLVDHGQCLAEPDRLKKLSWAGMVLASTIAISSLGTIGSAVAQPPDNFKNAVNSTEGLEYNLLGQVTANQLNQLDLNQFDKPLGKQSSKSSPSPSSQAQSTTTQPSPTVNSESVNSAFVSSEYTLLGQAAASQLNNQLEGTVQVDIPSDLAVPAPGPGALDLAQVDPMTSENSKDLDLFTQTQIPVEAPTDSPERIQERLSRYQNLSNFGNIFRGSPAISVANPVGFGADDNTAFVVAGLQSRTRFTNSADGALGFGVGLLNSVETVGLELSYTIASFGNSRPFGAGGFNLKVHRAFPEDFAVAIGWNGVITISDPFGDFKDSVYGVITKVFRVNDSVEDPFSRIAVSFGAGSGQFRSVDDIRNRRNTVNVFGGVAVRVIEQASAIVEWTGQDLTLGVSFVPIKDVYWTVTPAVRDITGAGDGARFVLGTSFGIQF